MVIRQLVRLTCLELRHQQTVHFLHRNNALNIGLGRVLKSMQIHEKTLASGRVKDRKPLSHTKTVQVRDRERKLCTVEGGSSSAEAAAAEPQRQQKALQGLGKGGQARKLGLTQQRRCSSKSAAWR